MRIQDAYTTWSVTYDQDRNRTRDLDEQVTRAALGAHHFASVLEIGCGTGKNTALLAAISEQVLALDFSEGMLALARQKVTAAHVNFQQADLTQPWPCPADSVQLVIGNLVLEHIEDLSHIFTEAARVLQVGGCFFLSELHPMRQYEGTQANFRQGEVTTTIPAFVHHLADFVTAAETAGLMSIEFREWWHAEDEGKPPRLVTFLFEKRAES